MGLKVSVNILGLEKKFGCGIHKILDIVATADRKGIDVVTLGDHLGFNRTAHDVRSETHAFPFTLEEPWPEPITFLSAVAAMTKQITTLLSASAFAFGLYIGVVATVLAGNAYFGWFA